MKEKIIIEGKSSNVNTLGISFFVGAILLFILGSIIGGHPLDFLDEIFDDYIVFFILILCCIIGAIVSYIAMNSCSLVITDKRIYGKATFGKSVNLPVDMISSVATGPFKSFSVSTASGNITFSLLENRDDLNAAATKLLMQRQEAKKNNDSSISNADELKKYKSLLDEGIITQEEFDAKRKQMLGL